jgi:histidine triad (HIT) family protein
MEEECIFCKIARGEVKAEKIYEKESVVAFLDVNPKTLGHSLVIPKKHVSRMTDLEDGLIRDVFIATKEVMQMLKRALSSGPDGFNIGINDGEVAGQEIPHMHVNIFPRFRGDKGKSVHYIVNNPPSEDISVTANKIRDKA